MYGGHRLIEDHTTVVACGSGCHSSPPSCRSAFGRTRVRGPHQEDPSETSSSFVLSCTVRCCFLIDPGPGCAKQRADCESIDFHARNAAEGGK